MAAAASRSPWKRVLLLLALALAAALLLGWAPLAAGFEDEEDDETDKTDVPIDLSIKAYEAAMASTDVWIVDFFQDDCSACVQIKSFMEQLAKDVYPFGVKVGIFDMKQSKAARNLAIAAGLVKLPALKVFVGPPKKNPYTGKALRESLDYVFEEGVGLDSKMLKRWLIKNVPSHVVKATAEDWSDVLSGAFDAEAGKGVVLTLSDRDTTPTLLKTMAIQFAEAYTFVEVPPSEKDVVAKFGVKEEDLAQLFVLPAGKAEAFAPLDALDADAAVLYEGDLREPAVLQEFLAKHAETKKPAAAGADEKKKEAEGKGKGEEKGKAGSKDEKPLVYRVLDGASFKTEVYKDTDAWMVWFKPTADATSEEWDKYVAKSEGLLKMGVVDCSDAKAEANAALCKAEGAAAFPFRAYPHGADKEDEAKGFVMPEGAYQECGESVPDVLRHVGDGSNQMLMDQEVNTAFGSYKSPIVILSNKPQPALLFKALALKLEPYCHFIFITNPTSQFLVQFNRAVVPSVHILVPQDLDLYKDVSAGLPTQHQLRIETYLPGMMGGMKLPNIANFFVQVLAQRGDQARAQKMVDALAGRGPAAGAGAGGGAAPAREVAVAEVGDAAAWAAACPGDGGAALCVLGLFRGGLVAPGVEGHVAMLKEVAGREGHGAEAPWAFAWADGTCLTDFADAFDVQEPKLPTVVVYSPRKQRFANFKGTLSAPAVSEFLRGILSGSIPVAPVLGEPRVDADTSRCTGLGTTELAAAAEGEMVEEEEDIGDLMAEILADEKRKKEELAAAVKRELEEEKKKAEAAAAEAEGEPKKKIVRRKKKKASDEL